MIQKESVRFYTRNDGFWWVQQVNEGRIFDPTGSCFWWVQEVNEGRIFDPTGSCFYFAEIWHTCTATEKKVACEDRENSYAPILSKGGLIVKIAR